MKKMAVQAAIDLPEIEQRMLRWMLGIGAVGLCAVLASGQVRVGVAFAVGAALGVLNFHWLCQTAKVLMQSPTSRVPRRTAVFIVMRYPIGLAGLAALFYGGWLPPLPLILGLLVPGGGVIVESLFLIGGGLHQKHAA